MFNIRVQVNLEDTPPVLTSIQVCDTQQPKKLTGQDDIHIKIPMSGCHAKTNWP